MGSFEKWDYVMQSVIRTVFYRTLGINSIHANINEMGEVEGVGVYG